MAIIPHGTPVTDLITPGLDDANTFPTHAAKFGKGGFEVRSSLIDIQTISADRREGKFCLSLLEKEFYYFDSITQAWEIYHITGSGTADDWMTVLGVTITPTLVSFDRPIYTPKLSTAPGTVSVGNIDISGANNTLSFINTTDDTRAILVGVVYKSDGTTSLKSYNLTPEEVHDRQMEFSDTQPSNPYTFPFTVPESVIRTGLFLMPAEAGDFIIESKDINGRMVTDSEKFTFRTQDIGNTVEIILKNHAIYQLGQTGTFTLKGAKVKGKVINGTFIPYFKSREYTIISRPEVVTEVNMGELHEENCAGYDITRAYAIPRYVSNVILRYVSPLEAAVITQPLPDIALVKDSTRIVISNDSTVATDLIRVTTFNAIQKVNGRTTYDVIAGQSVTFTACKGMATWYVTSNSHNTVDALSNIIDGGDASSVDTRVFDGGSA